MLVKRLAIKTRNIAPLLPLALLFATSGFEDLPLSIAVASRFLDRKDEKKDAGSEKKGSDLARVRKKRSATVLC